MRSAIYPSPHLYGSILSPTNSSPPSMGGEDKFKRKELSALVP